MQRGEITHQYNISVRHAHTKDAQKEMEQNATH